MMDSCQARFKFFSFALKSYTILKEMKKTGNFMTEDTDTLRQMFLAQFMYILACESVLKNTMRLSV
jgi:hypothetical protein